MAFSDAEIFADIAEQTSRTRPEYLTGSGWQFIRRSGTRPPMPVHEARRRLMAARRKQRAVERAPRLAGLCRCGLVKDHWLLDGSDHVGRVRK